MITDDYLEPYLQRWGLLPDGCGIVTHSSRRLPVLWGSEKAMLKVALVAQEKAGARLMGWWNGDGAARVFQQDDEAILMERAMGRQSLETIAMLGDDDRASLIIATPWPSSTSHGTLRSSTSPRSPSGFSYCWPTRRSTC